MGVTATKDGAKPSPPPPGRIGGRVLANMMAGGGYGGWPGGWSQDRIEQVLHYKAWVFVAIRAIAKEVAQQRPNLAFVTTAPVAEHPLARQRRYQSSLKSILPHETVQPVGDNHPIAQLFRHPNDFDVAWNLWYELILFLELTGNAYLWCVPNRLGRIDGTNKPAELWVIPSHWVWPRYGTNRLIDYYEIRPWIGPGMLRFPPEEIIAFSYKSPLHKIDGYAPSTAGAEWIDANESVNLSRFFQFKNGAFPMGALELSADFNDPNDQDIERIYAKLFGRLQGESNYGRPIVTPPGAKYQPLMIAPQEMAYVESADQLRDWILALFGVPKGVAGIEPAGDNISAYAPLRQFCRFTINPLLQYLGQVLTAHLASRWDSSLRVWWDDCTPDDPAQLNADIDCDVRSGAIVPNEVRAMRGRVPYAHGGDDPILPMGNSPLPINSGDDDDDLDVTPAEDAHYEDGKQTKAVRLPDVRQTQAFDCGRAATQAVLDFYGISYGSPGDLAAQLGTNPKNGTDATAICKLLREYGLAVREGRLELADLADLTERDWVVICPVQQGGTPDSQDQNKEGHYVVVFDTTPKSVLVQDPVDGPKRIGNKLWLRRWHDVDADGTEYRQFGIAVGPPPPG